MDLSGRLPRVRIRSRMHRLTDGRLKWRRRPRGRDAVLTITGRITIRFADSSFHISSPAVNRKTSFRGERSSRSRLGVASVTCGVALVMNTWACHASTYSAGATLAQVGERR